MTNKEIIRRILQLLKPYGLWLAAGLTLTVVNVAASLYIPVLSGQAVDLLVGKGSVDMTALTGVLKIIAMMIALTAASQWLCTLTNNHMAYHIVSDMRIKAFSHLQILPLSYLDSHKSGDTQARIITDIDQFSEGLLMGFTHLFSGLLTIVITLFFMLRINIYITLLVIAITPLSIIVAGYIAKNSSIYFRQQSAARGALTALASEMIGGIDTVSTFNMQQSVGAQFKKTDDQFRQAGFKAVFYSSITNPSTRFVNALTYAAVGISGALSALAGLLSVGQLTSFLSYASQYAKPFNEISGVVTELQNSLSCAQRLFELLDAETEKPDAPTAVLAAHPKGRVDFDHVAFCYSPAVPLITDFSLHVSAGQRIAIVGPTGCGKTTMINLLMRFYEIQGGSISIDGNDIRTLSRNNLRHNFGMVLQDSWLANDTVAANIAMGKAKASRNEIVAAARKSYADDFIAKLPHGYDTVLAADGSGLSAGQQQLLCISRVMLANPAMLILDEATSAIDTRTELLVQKAFAELMKNKTSFIVAHRLSTIKNADQIIVMNNGQIVQTGTHDQLLKTGGAYAKLYYSQFEATAAK